LPWNNVKAQAFEASEGFLGRGLNCGKRLLEILGEDLGSIWRWLSNMRDVKEDGSLIALTSKLLES
jgi:hypothetical protein